MRTLNVSWRDSVQWLGAGPVVDYGDGTDDESQLRHDIQHAHMIAVDPGKPCGLAIFSYDLEAFGIALHEVDPELLAHVLIKSFPRGCDLDIVCETPLHGAVRVFDPWPQRVRGFLELWHAAEHDENEFVPAQVGWLKAGVHFAHVTTRGVSRHAKDALYYGVMATTIHPLLKKRLEEAT